MKKIAVIGDSHAWGGGASGSRDQARVYAPWEPTALWLMPFTIPGFVNILRDKINRRYPSYAKEDREVHDLPYRFETTAELIRFQLFAEDMDANAFVFVNGQCFANYQIPANSSPKVFITVTINCREKTVIEITGSAKVFRIEEYGGSCAVINCGFAGSTAEHYLEECFHKTIVPLKPDYIIVEPCTINDWLIGRTDVQYYDAVCQLLKKAAKSAKTIMLTVSPVCGEQKSPMASGNPEYESYVKCSVDAANLLKIPIADAHRIMLEKLTGLTEEQKFSLLYSDAWHPNDLGHKIYAEAAWEQLEIYLQ